MPFVSVKMLSGRTKEQKKALAKAITEAMTETCGAKPEGTYVVIEEVDGDHWAVGGAMLSER